MPSSCTSNNRQPKGGRCASPRNASADGYVTGFNPAARNSLPSEPETSQRNPATFGRIQLFRLATNRCERRDAYVVHELRSGIILAVMCTLMNPSDCGVPA